MPMLSVSKAAKLFDVSRPTLQKALKDGAITGKKVIAGGSESWQIDSAELSRLYALRDPLPAKIPRQDEGGGQSLDVGKLGEDEGLAGEAVKKLEAELQAARAELEVLRASKAEAERELAASQAVADERRRILDGMGEERRQLVDALKRLPQPEDRAQRPRLWAWLTSR